MVEVADVPEQGELAAPAENAVDLRECGGAVKPVEGLGDRNGVGAVMGQAGVLGGTGAKVHLGHVAAEQLEHRLDWFDGDYPGAGPDQRAGQLSGSGGEVDDGCAGP